MTKLQNIKPDIRHLDDMKEMFYDKIWKKTAPNLELYYMYRGIEEKNGLRYDITVIPSQMLGQEFAKTKGHQHLNNFQELYSVLEGEAIFLIQKENDKKVEDVFAVRAQSGESIIIPPGYSHVTINPSKTDLKMSNWVSKKCVSEYKEFEKLAGACYYYTKSGWIKNKNYKEVPELRFEEPLKSALTDLDFLN
ncbi:glucose-6-phosphate isomerase [Patescibacteria group bacterium]|nr:glucose-6-phosphate isomerase [Patescibacteria group bacterium]MBU1876751.1 glucose-6-phosphate isomerase [Patescibacteria group bacterium]